MSDVNTQVGFSGRGLTPEYHIIAKNLANIARRVQTQMQRVFKTSRCAKAHKIL
jgi:hypothetical protein